MDRHKKVEIISENELESVGRDKVDLGDSTQRTAKKFWTHLPNFIIYTYGLGA